MKRSYTLDRTLSHLNEGVRRLLRVVSEIDEMRHNKLEEASRLVWEVLKSADYEALRREDRKENQETLTALMGKRADRHQNPKENQDDE